MSEYHGPEYDAARECERAEEHLHRPPPLHEWSRCDYCGRLIGYAEYDAGTAVRSMGHEYDWMAEDVLEVYDTYHVRCKKDLASPDPKA